MVQVEGDYQHADTHRDTDPEDELRSFVSGAPIETWKAELTTGESGEKIHVDFRDHATIFRKGTTWMMGPAAKLRLESADSVGDASLPPDRSESGADVRRNDQFISTQPRASRGLARILSRDPEVRRRSLEWQEQHGNPLEQLQNFLSDWIGDTPDDIEEWNRMIDEPY